MKGSFTKKVGATEFTFEFDAATNAEFFEQVSFYTELPSAGPDGANDLIFRVREVDSNTFYEIYCPSKHKVWTFGQHKKPRDGSLFPKSKCWEPAYGDPPVVEKSIPREAAKVQNPVESNAKEEPSVGTTVAAQPKIVAKVPLATVPKVIVPTTPKVEDVDTSDLKPEAFRPATGNTPSVASNVSPEILAQSQSILDKFLNQSPNQ